MKKAQKKFANANGLVLAKKAVYKGIQVFVLLWVSILCHVKAQAPKWNSVRIDGMGFVTGVIANKAAQNEVYVRTDVAGMFRWDNPNARWLPLLDSTKGTWNHMSVESFAIDQTTSGPSTVIYAATKGILKSVNQGKNWSKTNFPDSVYMNGNGFWRHCGERLAIDPQNRNVLYFGSRKQGLYRSVDGGINWTRYNSIWTDGGKGNNYDAGGIAFVAIDPRSTQQSTSPTRSKNIYIGIIGNAKHSFSIYRSTDGGSTWSVMNQTGAPPNTQHPVRGVVASDGTFYVTTTSDAASTWQGFPNSNGRIFKYNPTSNAWTNITPSGCSSGPLTYGCASWGGLAVDPNNPSKIYASVFGETIRDLFYSVDGGANWKIVTDDPASAYPSGVHQKAVYNIPAWGYAGSGFKFSWSGGIAVDPFNGNKIYVTTGYAVHRTNDITLPTVTWDTPMKGLEELVVNVVKVPAKLDGAVLLSGVADMGGFRHTDVLTPPTTKFVPDKHGITTSIDWMVTDPNVIVKVGGDQGTNGINSDNCTECGVSVDNGKTWTSLTIPAKKGWGGYTDGNIAIARSAKDHSSLNMVWFPTAKCSGTCNLPVYSFNSGKTWAECSFDFGTVWQNSCTDQYWFNAEMVASDKVKDSTFYAFVPNWYSNNSTYCQFFRSTDGGKNFKKIFSAQKQYDIYGKSIAWSESHKVTIKPHPTVAGEVWVKIGSTLFRSTNALAPITATTPSFNVVNTGGLTNVINFGWGAPLSGSANPTLYVAGTVNGWPSVYRSTDLGKTWEDILGNEIIPVNQISSMEGDMKRPGRLMVGTSNRGVFYYDAESATPVNKAPTVSVSASKTAVSTNESVTFNVTASDADGSVVSYNWNWGNATENGAGNPTGTKTHSWTTAGTYNVTLAVTDNGSPSATSTSAPVAITVTSPNQDTKCGEVSNPGFESGLTGWTNNGNTAISTSSKTGTNAAKTGSGEGGMHYGSLISVSAGTEITFKGWAKVDGAPSWAGFGIDYLNASGTEVGEIVFTVNATTYTEYSKTETAPSGAANIRIWTWKSGTTGNFYLDDVCLTKNVSTNVPVTGVSLSPTSVSLNVGQTSQLTATVAPSNATNKNVSWSTSNASVATVGTTGLVTAVAAGTATITVATQDGNKTATASVTVSNPPLSITSLTPTAYQLSKLNTGITYYTDRTYTLTSVPAAYVGLDFIKTKNDDKSNSSASYITFNVNKNVTVFLAIDARTTSFPSHFTGWTKTADQVRGEATFNLYKKDFAAGQVTIGGVPSLSNLFVIIKEVPLSGEPTALSLESFTGPGVIVFPNPVSEEINVVFANESDFIVGESLDWQLINEASGAVWSGKALVLQNGKVKISFKDVPEGIYLLRVNTKKVQVEQKVIVEK